MRFIIIGCGSIGQRHMGNLLSLGHQVLAYNRGEARREQVLDRFGVRVSAELEPLLDEGADAAVIATPNHLHLEHAILVARKGMHLFIEKPLSHTTAGLQDLRNEVSARGLITHVGTNLRFHFGPRQVFDALRSGWVGEPLWGQFWGGMHLPHWHPGEDYRDMYSAKAAMGGGAVLDFIHELDLALWFYGVPERVAAMENRTGWLDIETEDLCDVLLSYPKGFQVNIHLDYLQWPFQRGIRLVGTKGWICWDLTRQGVERYSYERGEPEWEAYPDAYDHNAMYLAQMKYFVECLQKGEPSMSDLDAGWSALNLASRVKTSAKKECFA